MRATYKYRMGLAMREIRNLQDKPVFESMASDHQRETRGESVTYGESPVVGDTECFGDMNSSHCTWTFDK